MNMLMLVAVLLPLWWTSAISQGPCAAAGITDCNCMTNCGAAGGCFCDLQCQIFNDCCDDFLTVCTVPTDLAVNITSTPGAPPYPAATLITLRCLANTPLPVSYNWSVYCDDSLQFYFATPQSSIVTVPSSPLACETSVNCTVQDSMGNSASAIWGFGATTGVGLSGPFPRANNSAVIAGSTGDIGTIYCHSSTMQSNVGRWLSPEGVDITLDITDDFIIQFYEGSFPSYNRFRLLPSVAFSSADGGVYSCIVPDENGLEQTLHIGIYPSGYTATIQVPRIQRYSQSPLVIECITTGLPATVAFWARASTILVQDSTYLMYQVLTDAATTTYSNRLVINQSFHQARGFYYCLGGSDFTGPIQDPAGPNMTVDIHFFSLFVPGDFELITCPYDLPTWRNSQNGQIVSNGPGLLFPFVNDSIHEVRYVCADGVSTNQLFYTTIVNVPDTALEVTVTETNTPMVGSSYSVTCNAAKSITGLINDPVPVWYDSSGNAVAASGGISLNGPVTTSSSSELTLNFATVQTSYAGVYICQGTLDSPALESPIVKQLQFNITMQIPQPIVTVSSPTPPPYSSGGTLTLECTALVNSAVNTPIDVTISWTRSGDTITDGGRYTISEVMTVGSFMHRSSLIVSDLNLVTDPGEYNCAVSVRPSLPSPYISDAQSTTASVTIAVIGPVLEVELAPTSVRVIDAAPHNSFTLRCNITVADETIVPNTQWWKQMGGSSTISLLAHNGVSVNIINSANGQITTSTLTASEAVSGNYIYTCMSSILHEGNTTMMSANATVTVQGLLFPLQPANVQATVTSFTSATIDWDVPIIVYTPESYLVQYGTSPQALQQSVSLAGSLNIDAVDQHFTVELMGLQHDSTYYYTVTATSSAGSTSTIVLSFTIQDIPILTTITVVGSPIAGSTFSLVCTVSEEEDISGIPIATWLDSMGQPIHSGGDFLITSQLLGLTTNLTLQFNPLRGSHAGEYTCRAELRELLFNETTSHNLLVEVAVLPVSINSSTTEYLAASQLTLRCHVGLGAVGTVTYQWSSSCMGECFVSAQTTQQVVRNILRAADSGQHTCTATDELGNTGSGSIQVRVEGVRVYLSGTGVISNNTILLAGPGGNIERLQCISGSTAPNVGLWISPSGQDITNLQTDPFDTTVGGSTNPGHLDISPAPGETITSIWEGVYTCSIPDETGEQQVFYIGIYLTSLSPSITDIGPLVNLLTFTLNCSSNGAAASSVTWLKDGSILTPGSFYRTHQILRNGINSVYDNVLEVSSAIAANFLVGNYTCRVQNTFGAAERTINFRGLAIERSQDVFLVGQSASLNCTSDLGVSSVEWMDSNGVVIVSSSGPSALLEFDLVQDSLHNTTYTCRAIAEFGIQEQDANIITEVDAEDISISITSSPIPAFIGQDLSLTCTVETIPGIQNIPTISWQYPNGSLIFNTTQVTVSGPTVSTNSVSNTVTFHPLSAMHGGDFICLADIATNSPPHQLSRAAEYDIPVFVGEPAPPSTPVDATATNLTSTSAMIQWGVPSVEYTREQYIVRYSLDRESVRVDRSVTVDGNLDTTQNDQVYTAALTGLEPNSEYFYSISATNSIGSTSTATLSFMTLSVMTSASFQLLLGRVHDCNEWRFENTQDKLADIGASLLSRIQEECQCLQGQNQISNAEFSCFDDPQYVVFRATFMSANFDGEQFTASVEQLIQSEEVTILVQSNRLTVVSDCSLRIRSLTDTFDCEAPTDAATGAPVNVSIGAIVGASLGGCVVLLIIAAVIIIIAVLHTQRKRKKFEVTQRQEATLFAAPTAQGNTYANSETLMNAPPATNPPPYSMTRYSSEGSYVTMNSAAVAWHHGGVGGGGGGGGKGETLYDEIPAEKQTLAQIQYGGTKF